MKKHVLLTVLAIMAYISPSSLMAQGVKPLPTLHVDGKWLADTHGKTHTLPGCGHAQ